jgi:hypothetical protein
MKQVLRKYLPWALVLLLAGLSAYYGIGTPDVPPAEPVTITVRDTVHDTTVVIVQVRDRVTHVVRDTITLTEDDARAEIARLDAERDSLNREILRIGETRADLDTTLTLALGDSSRVTVRASVAHENERGLTTLSLAVVEAVLAMQAECPSPSPWGWITAAGGALAAVLAAIFK